MRLPVSSIFPQIRQGAGNTREARAARMPRHWDLTEAAKLVIVGQSYAGNTVSESKNPGKDTNSDKSGITQSGRPDRIETPASNVDRTM
jgi:hypothetical protein